MNKNYFYSLENLVFIEIFFEQNKKTYPEINSFTDTLSCNILIIL